MENTEVLKSLEYTIKKVGIDIRKKKGSVGSDKLNSYSKLVNSYSKLLERAKRLDEEPQNNHYELIESGNSHLIDYVDED